MFKRFYGLVLALIFCVSVTRYATADDVVGAAYYGGVWSLYDHTVIGRGQIIDAPQVYIESSVILENNGVIRGDVYVCPGCDLQIRGNGVFEGRIYSGEGGIVTRVVTGGAIPLPIDVVGEYNVLGQGEIGISWSEMVALSIGADKIVLRDAKVRFAPSVMRVAPVVELQGLITLDMGGADLQENIMLMSNIVGDGTIVLSGVAPDALYAPYIEMIDGVLWLRAVRETDYYKILNDDVGLFLNAVREINPTDSTLVALDSATSIDEVWHIISRANILNPMNLMRPIEVFNAFQANDVAYDCGTGALKICSRVGEIMSADFRMSVLSVGAVAHIGHRLAMGITAYGADLKMVDDDFGDAVMYGANVRGEYSDGVVLVRALYGRTYSDFAVPYIFDAGRVASNPKGVSDYGVMDIGWRFDVLKSVNVSPFIGVWYQDMEILSKSRNDSALRAGGDFVWRTGGSDLYYDYKLRAVARTDGVYQLQALIGFWTVFDGVGADISVAVLRDDDLTAFQISASGKIRF